MKDTSRPPSSRPAPYSKRNSSGDVSPTRSTRRPHDTPKLNGQISSSRTSERAHSSRRHEDYPRAISSADDDRRSVPKTGEAHIDTHARKHASSDRSARDRISHSSALSTHADVPGPSLRLPLTPAPPALPSGTPDSPPPSSVTTFLRSIELPDESPSAPPPPSCPVPPSSLRPPPLATDSTNKRTRTNCNEYQVSLVYKGYPFTYDLSALPDDPKGTIALLTITQSDPGAYILVGAHYRRTGRARAACAVIRSLLEKLNSDGHSDVEKAKGDATVGSDTSTVILPSPGSPCPKTMSVFKEAAVRPAMLLLAACELDISRERPDDPESDNHASTAHELFRAVYGVINDGIVAEAVRPKAKNALGLEFSSNRSCPSSSEVARVKQPEKSLSSARATHKSLQDRLAVCNNRLTRAEDNVHALESRCREMRVQLDVERDENRDLRRRLAQSDQRARELTQCPPSAESRVWGRLKDLLFDNLGGMRGE